MAAKKKLVLRVSYHGKDGVIPAGQVLELPAKEAREFLDQGLGCEPGSQALTLPAPLAGREAEALRGRVVALEAELATASDDCEARLQEARDYALSLEARLREAGLFDEPQTDAGN